MRPRHVRAPIGVASIHARTAIASRRGAAGSSCLAFAIGILLALCLPLYAHAQISPGPLARAHQSLNGPTNCTKCHAVSTHSPEFRCLDCHREVAAEITEHRGLHATYPQSGPPGSSCVRCHSDHNGVDFSLIHWQPTASGFDHAKTGYGLDGKHANVSCRSCHNAQHIAPAERALLQGKDLNHTWLGLSTSCSTCHEDKHQGRFGTDCARCHSTVDWKAARVDPMHFDHAKTQFSLTGKHRDVACEKCHTPDAGGKPRWSGIAFAACSSCHVDPHKGQFREGCDFCHTTSTWDRSRYEHIFDHSKTQYPLVGKHLTVSCVSCHRGGDFKAPIPHGQCADCHKPDPHDGQFLKLANNGRCENCHTVQGFRPSTFTIERHARTGLPLGAPHDRVTCAQCHVPAGAHTRYMLAFALCIDCHKDPHSGQFAGPPWQNHCEKCHTGFTFKSNTMTLALHQQTRFPLAGSHLAVACDDCHKPMGDSTVAVYHFEHLRCTTCHADVHDGQFAARMEKVDTDGHSPGCQACHTTTEWKDLAGFDHASTGFPLAGSHRAVACIDCHRPPALERTMLHVHFAAAPQQCAACHDDPHGGQFGERENNCASCHNANKWRPSLFDHEKTDFPLKDAHENVACPACHVNRKPVKGELVLFYKPTPTACEACHGGGIPGRKPVSRVSQPHDILQPEVQERGQ